LIRRSVFGAVLVAVAALTADPAWSDGHRHKCLPKPAVTIAKGQKVRVFRQRHGDMTACLYSSGRRRSLEDRTDGVVAQLPPSLDVAGEWAALVLYLSDPTGPSFIDVVRTNVRTGKARSVHAFDPDSLSNVGTVKANRRGSTTLR
jgi:hypothetical protein